MSKNYYFRYVALSYVDDVLVDELIIVVDGGYVQYGWNEHGWYEYGNGLIKYDVRDESKYEKLRYEKHGRL